MSKQRVIDMRRRQQKAVFARMGDGSGSAGSQSNRDKILEREFGKPKEKTLKQIAEAPVSKKAKIAFWKAEEISAKSDIRDGVSDLKTALQTGKSPAEMAKGSVKAKKKISFGRAKLRHAKKQRLKAESIKNAGKYKVAMKLPAVGKIKGEWVEGNPMSRKEATALAKAKKRLGWKAKIVKA